MSYNMSDISNSESPSDVFVKEYSYKVQLPEKCCSNCAYMKEHGCVCARMSALLTPSAFIGAAYAYIDEDTIRRSQGVDVIVSDCGYCKMHMPSDVIRMYMDCGSFEEADMRYKIAFGDDPVVRDEINDWFAERKATKKMKSLLLSMVTSNFDFVTPPPIKPDLISWADPGKFLENLHIERFVLSDSFYRCQRWISENKDAYDQFMDIVTSRRRSLGNTDWFCSTSGLKYTNIDSASSWATERFSAWTMD